VEETWDDYPDEGPHKHSPLELAFGRLFYRDVQREPGGSQTVYMRPRNGLVFLAAGCWLVIGALAVRELVQNGSIPLAYVVFLGIFALGLVNYWWFEWVRVDDRSIERSQLLGLVRRSGLIETLQKVESRPLAKGYGGTRTPSMRFVFSDHTFEVRAAAHHWVDGRKLMMRLYQHGVPIAPKLVRHFELNDASVGDATIQV